jgi:hypothetical protein
MAARRDEAARSIPVGVIETLLLRFEVSITIETRTIVGASTRMFFNLSPEFQGRGKSFV